MKNVCEELEKLQKLERLYICKVSREELYDLYVTVCFELREAHRSLKYREKHRSSARIYGNMLRIFDAETRIEAVMRIYRRLKSTLPRDVWFAFKGRHKRERKEGYKSL